MWRKDVNFNEGCPPPFQTHHGPVTFPRILSMVLCFVCLFPIRLVAVLTAVLGHGVFVFIAGIGLPSEPTVSYSHPTLSSPWRFQLVKWSGRLLARLLLWGLGFWHISETYYPGFDRSKMPAIVVSNHVSYTDILYYIASSCPMSFVSKDGVRTVPFIGTYAKAYCSLFVDRAFLQEEKKTEADRGGESSNAAVVRGLRERVRKCAEMRDSSMIPRILVFPEGTTTNGRYLLKFKRGAFLPLSPVQPVVLRYSYQHFDPAYLRLTGAHILAMMCQWSNSLHAEWMSPVGPVLTEKDVSEAARQDDADRFAERVWRVMADSSGLPRSDATIQQKKAFMNDRFWPHQKGKGAKPSAASQGKKHE